MSCRAVSNCHLSHLECNELVGYYFWGKFLSNYCNSNNYLVAVFAKYRHVDKLKLGLTPGYIEFGVVLIDSAIVVCIHSAILQLFC